MKRVMSKCGTELIEGGIILISTATRLLAVAGIVFVFNSLCYDNKMVKSPGWPYIGLTNKKIKIN